MHKLAQALVAAALAALPACALAQAPGTPMYKPPHFNDPHPPANPPPYMLPSPPTTVPRPGVPLYPGAPHFNDPHYRRTEPQITWPKGPPAQAPGPRVQRSRPYDQSSSLAAAERRAAQKREEARRDRQARTTLQECFGRWDRGLGMSRASWESTCRRLAADGRLRTP